MFYVMRGVMREAQRYKERARCERYAACAGERRVRERLMLLFARERSTLMADQ